MARPTTIIVTSNYSIREIWSDEQTYLPLERRFKVIRYDKNGPLTMDVQPNVLQPGSQLDQPSLIMGARDSNFTRSELNHFEMNAAIAEDPYIPEEDNIIIDNSCKRSTPDHSVCDFDSQPFCLDCSLAPCICEIIEDEGYIFLKNTQSIPYQSDEEEVSENLLDMDSEEHDPTATFYPDDHVFSSQKEYANRTTEYQHSRNADIWCYDCNKKCQNTPELLRAGHDACMAIFKSKV